MRYKKPTVTIRDYLLQWYPTIDVQPVGQRLNTTNIIEAPIGAEKPAKSQGIIRTILEGENIGQITLVRTDNASYSSSSSIAFFGSALSAPTKSPTLAGLPLVGPVFLH